MEKVNKKYLEFSIEELAQEQCFIGWVQNREQDAEWMSLAEQHPEFGEKMETARKIVKILDDSSDNLSGPEVHSLWKLIDNFDDSVKSKSKVRRLKMWFRYAAVLLVLISMAGVAVLFYTSSPEDYQFTADAANSPDTESVLILPDGNKINLKKDYSTVELQEEQIQINNDSIVHLKDKADKLSGDRMNEVIVPYGKRTQLVLEDGTKVWLNAGSRLAFPQKFNGKKRTVYLEGEGYFEVAKNTSQPFIVNTSSVNIEVTGTKFNISAYQSDDFCQTVLLEGSVNVIGKSKLLNNRTSMLPNQKVIFNKNEQTLVRENEYFPELYVAWTEGWYSFSNESLAEIFKKVERYYNVEIEYNPDLISKALPVSGKLDLKDSITEVMKVLSLVVKVDFQIVEQEKVIVIRE
ncbi:MAG: DUF4974 domain-containing protein [Bacteroidia bacterium]|nr:DUF4974 domain-containing protein [Bacteroidia bacterium]